MVYKDGKPPIHVSGVHDLEKRELYLPPNAVNSFNLAPGAAFDNLPQAIQGYTHDIVFSSTAQSLVSWLPGTITFYDGKTQSISAAGSPYILASGSIYTVYFDLDDPTPSTLKFTANYASVMTVKTGALALVQRGSNSATNATIIPNRGKMPYLTADVIQCSSITLSALSNSDPTYGKLLKTDTEIVGGHIKLTAQTMKDGDWYDQAGVDINATTGITIYGSDTAFRTRASKGGANQCYVGADGRMYAGGGAAWLDSTGFNTKGQGLYIRDLNSTTVGMLNYTDGYFYIGSVGNNLELYSGNGSIHSYGHFAPFISGWYGCGAQDRYWGGVYSATYWLKPSHVQLFHARPDIALVKAIGGKTARVCKKKLVQTGVERVWAGKNPDGSDSFAEHPRMEAVDDPATEEERLVVDMDTLPPELKDESGKFIHVGNMASLALGAIRMLAEKVEKLEAELEQLRPAPGKEGAA